MFSAKIRMPSASAVARIVTTIVSARLNLVEHFGAAEQVQTISRRMSELQRVAHLLKRMKVRFRPPDAPSGRIDLAEANH
jgi:hypothetical protein